MLSVRHLYFNKLQRKAGLFYNCIKLYFINKTNIKSKEIINFNSPIVPHDYIKLRYIFRQINESRN